MVAADILSMEARVKTAEVVPQVINLLPSLIRVYVPACLRSYFVVVDGRVVLRLMTRLKVLVTCMIHAHVSTKPQEMYVFTCMHLNVFSQTDRQNTCIYDGCLVRMHTKEHTYSYQYIHT